MTGNVIQHTYRSIVGLVVVHCLIAGTVSEEEEV